ncbi:MAG: Fic family protein [Alphaproteobacteria bacterium]|nr:Fic family protein [Alphaproteobacteria bacterium]
MDWNESRLSQRLQLSPEITEKIYSMIAEIDAVKNTYALTNRLLPQTIERLTQSVIVTSTGASNRIEGNRLSDEQVDALYRNMRIRSFKTRDEQEVAGYIEMLQRIFENYADIPVTESHILQLHKDMLAYSDKDEGHKGRYKFGPNRVEAKDQSGKIVGIIFDPTPPHLTEKEMRELIGWYQWAQKEKFKHPLILIANFAFEYLAIHPFQDGNGRTSRLLTNLMLLQNGYAFSTLVSHEKLIEKTKAEYYLALNKTQRTWKKKTEDVSPWLLYIFDVFRKQAQEAQRILESDQFEYLLSEKQLAFWQWAQGLAGREFSRRDAIDALRFPPRTVEQIIKKFLDMKKLNQMGQGRATRYRVV